MKNPNLPTILIPLLAALAIYFPLAGVTTESANQQQQPQQRASSASSKSETPPPPRKLEQDEAARLLGDFFGLNRLPSESKQAIYGGSGEKFQVETLIATVPDPKDSRLDYLFDHHLDAIQRAIEAAGFVLDRHSLPWEKQKAAQSQATATTPQRRDYTREPGVILFRKIKFGESRLLLLFLVGETPTSGIHKTAFRNALNQFAALPDWLVEKPEGQPIPKIRLLGPTFSGSASSLAIALKSWMDLFLATKKHRPEVRIISGSATAIDKEEFLSRVGSSGEVNFNSTVLLDGKSRQAFIEDLVEHFSIEKETPGVYQSPQIALLGEGNTTYGQEALKGNGTVFNPKITTINKVPVLEMTFPLHIYQLRSEAAKVKPARKETQNGLLAPSDNIALPLEESGEPKTNDVVPLFSTLEPASIEQVLTNILSAVNRESIRYIGLFTTDVRDRIFLVRELRRHCPNAAIFIFSSDLLYLHSEANLDFQGALVITPYPLFSLNQFWSHPFNGDRNRLQFSTQSAQGCYNAALALLDVEYRMIEYGSPFDQGPSQSRRPALWLGVVGRNAIWPVRTLNNAEDSYTYAISAPDSRNNPGSKRILVGYRDHSSVSIAIMLSVSLLCLVPSFVLLLHLARGKLEKRTLKGAPDRIRQWLSSFGLINRSLIGRIFCVDEKFRYDFDRRIYLFSCCVSLLIIALASTIVALLPDWIDYKFKDYVRWEHSFWFHLPAYSILALTAVVLLSVIVWLFFSIVDWARLPHIDWRSRLLAIFSLLISPGLLALACIALGCLVWQGTRDEKSASEALFFFLRATDFRSGVSLLLPWIFAGLASFLSFFTALRRLDLAEKMYSLDDSPDESDSPDSFLNFKSKSFSGLDDLENNVKSYVIGRIFSVPGVIPLIFLILAPYLHRFVIHHIVSIEGRWFDMFFIATFYIVPLLLGWAFLRFFWISLSLMRLLRRMEWHPLFSAPIDTKDPDYHMLPKVNLMSTTPTYNAMSISIMHAREFFRLRDKDSDRNRMDEADQELQNAIKVDSEGHWREALKPRWRAQQAISAASKDIADWMESRWTDLKDESALDKAVINKGRVFMIGHVASFLQYIVVHLQNLAGLVSIGLILLLVAVTSYPFQPRESLLLFGWVAIIVVVLVTLFVFVQLSRDKIFSLLSGTTPGEVNFSRDLIYRVLIHGIIPIIALLGAQFPEAVRNILSWLSVLGGKSE